MHLLMLKLEPPQLVQLQPLHQKVLTMVIFRMEHSTQNGNVVSIPGWDITLGPIDLGPDDGPWDDVIGGHPTPTDKTPNTMQTGVDTDDRIPANPYRRKIHLQNPKLSLALSNNGELRLQTSSFSLPGFGIHHHHGPYVVSQDAVDLEVGDSVSFEWFGMSGGDAYDIYGYLLEENTGQTITLVNDSPTWSVTSISTSCSFKQSRLGNIISHR